MKNTVLKTFATAVVAICATVALAETYTWTGSSGGNWDDGANWTASDSATGTVPTSSDDVVFNTTVTVSLNGSDRTVADFQLSGSPTVTFTGSEKYVKAATFTGTGTISLSDTRLGCTTASGSIPATIVIDIPEGASKCRLTALGGGKVSVYSPLTGKGEVMLNYSGPVNAGIILCGDNSAFAGTIKLDTNTNVRNSIGASTAGSENMRFINPAYGVDNGTIWFTGDDDNPPVLKFGSLYTGRSSNAYRWRFKQTGKIILEVGHLNGMFQDAEVEDRIAFKLGENSTTGNVTIRKVGTGTLELWNAAPRYGVQIDNGTVLVTSDKAMNTYANGDIVFGHDSDATGGTLKYGVNKWNSNGDDLEEDAYTDVTTDYSSLIKNSYAPVHIDTNGKDVNYASTLDSSNVGGMVKDGKGQLTLAYRQKPLLPLTVTAGTLKIQWDPSGVITNGTSDPKITVADDAILHLTRYAKAQAGIPAPLYGAGTVKIDSWGGQSARINDSTTLANFTGTLEFTGDNSDSAMSGFQQHANGFSGLTLKLSAEPSSAETRVFKFETNGDRTLGALQLLHANAKIDNGLGHMLTIGSKSQAENIINGYISGSGTLKKSGSTTPLILGSGFKLDSGATLNVAEASLLTVSNDLSSTDYTVTIASGIPLAGSGKVSASQFSTAGKYVATPGVDSLTVDGAVDLDSTTLTINSFTPKDGVTSYTLLTATSFSGTPSTTAVVDSEGGAWTVAASDTTLTLTPATIDPTSEDGVGVKADSEDAAIAAVTVAIPSTVASECTSLTADTYKSYFSFTATETTTGSGVYTVAIAGLSEDEVVLPAYESALGGLVDTSVSADSNVSVTVKPGLYYAFVTGTDVSTLGNGTLTLATGSTMTYTKPADATVNYIKVRISATAE